MRSLNCLLVQNAHSVLCVRIVGVVEIESKNVSGYSKTVLAKNIMFGSFPGYTFGSQFSKLFTHIHNSTVTQPYIDTYSPWAVHTNSCELK